MNKKILIPSVILLNLLVLIGIVSNNPAIDQNSSFYFLYCTLGLVFSYVLLHTVYCRYIRGKKKELDAFITLLSEKHMYLFFLFSFFVIYILFYLNPQRVTTFSLQLSFYVILTVFSLYVLYNAVYKKVTFKSLTLMVISLSGFLRIIYMFYTPFDRLRQHDVFGLWGHLEYIKHIAENFSLPPSGIAQAYHPPVHHFLSAIVYNLGKLMFDGEFFAYKLIQLFMVFLSILTLIYFYKILVELKCSSLAIFVGVSIYAFHPTNIYVSSFLNNDNTFLFFFVLSFYYMLKWYRQKTLKNILILSLFTSLTILTKKSGLTLLPILFLVFVKALGDDRKNVKTYIKQYTASFFLILPLSMSFQIRNYLRFDQGLGFTPPVVFSALPNTVHKLFYLPLKRLFSTPFTYAPFSTESGGETYVEYLFKSSLFGEWQFNGLETLAKLLIGATILLVLLFVIYLPFIKKKELLKYDYIFLFNLLIPLVLIIKLRIDYPFVCSQNFRYAAPILISFAYFLGKAADRFTSTKYPMALKVLVGLPIVAFCLLSTIFVLKIGM